MAACVINAEPLFKVAPQSSDRILSKLSVLMEDVGRCLFVLSIILLLISKIIYKIYFFLEMYKLIYFYWADITLI